MNIEWQIGKWLVNVGGNIFLCVCAALILFLFVMFVLGLFNRWLPRYFCDHFPYWHIKPKEMRCEGINVKGICPRCGKEVMSDSQGNWF